MNIAKSSECLDLLMSGEELDDFKRYLCIAIEDLVNVRPDNPKRYFALCLCRALPADDSIKYDFPELGKDLTIEKTFKSDTLEIPGIDDSASKNSKYEYPEGFQSVRRNSVYGESLVRETHLWTPPVHEKAQEVIGKLREILRKNILFSDMGEERLLKVIMAMEPLEIPSGTVVVKQNDEGNCCFFVEDGKLECFVQERGFVCEYVSGDSFGEVSIMYGNIRGATIKVISIQSLTPAKLWKLDRSTYKKIVLSEAVQTQTKFIEFISEVDIFRMSYLENVKIDILNQLAKHCHQVTYAAGSDLFVPSTDRYFYLIEQGRVQISLEGKQLAMLHTFDMFGGRDIFGLEAKADKAKAESECVIYRIPEPVIGNLLKDVRDDLKKFFENKLM